MAASSVAWIQVTLTDLKNAYAGPLAQAFTSTALSSGQSSPVPYIIADATDELLGAIGYSGRYAMDASYGTVSPNVIPPNLKRHLVDRIGRILKTRLNMEWLPQETKEEEKWDELLRNLKEGKHPVDVSDNPGNNLSVQPGAVTPTLEQTNRFRRSQLNNL